MGITTGGFESREKEKQSKMWSDVQMFQWKPEPDD